MNSMTGFGKSELKSVIGRFEVEISSVNNRFLEISVRLPRQFSPLESKVRDLVSSKINRGKAKVYISFDESDDSPGKFLINESAFKAYYKQLEKLKKEFKLEGEIKINDLLLLPEISNPAKDSIDEKMIWPPMEKVVTKAVNQLLKMRKSEGIEMKKDMTQRLSELETMLKGTMKLSGNSIEKRRERLSKKISDLMDSTNINKERLEEEIAIFADRIDITEECTRLSSHFKQYGETLKKKEPVGKQLNFILQEMNREVNTIASKSFDVEISALSISMKNEIEKIRELVQNVE